jgi:hypothetical protein
MKKIILAAILAFNIVSCSDDHDCPQNITGTNATAVTAKFGVGKDAFPTTGKSVNRGDIPTTINRITVDVVNSNSAILPNQTVFDLVASGGATQFLIDNVASGSNNFTAKATTTGGSKLSLEPYDFISNDDTDAKIAAKKNAVPHANYEAVVGMNIILGTAQEIAFPLLTNHGRLIVDMETATILSNTGRKVEVISQRFNADHTPISAVTTNDLTGNKSLIAVWNDDTALKGNYTKYTVNVYNDAAGTTLEKTFERTITIIESTGITSKLTITGEGLTESINYGTFTVPEWTEISN